MGKILHMKEVMIQKDSVFLVHGSERHADVGWNGPQALQ